MMNLGEELLVEGVTYVLINGEKIRMMTGDNDTWICDLCQLNEYCKALEKDSLASRCGPYQHIFVKKLEV